MDKEVDHVVVYGTLRKAQHANFMLSSCEYLDLVKIGGSMYTLGGFPGIRLDNPGEFIGELYRLPEDVTRTAVLSGLDRYEGYRPADPTGSLYTREVIDINDVSAYIYQIVRQPNALSRIDSGDWLEHRNQKYG